MARDGVETWMPVYVQDLLVSTAAMSPAQFGGYVRLLLTAWANHESGGLPNDMEECCRIAGGLSPADWQKIRGRLIVSDDGEHLTHARLELEWAKAVGVRDVKRRNLEKARQARQRESAADSIPDSIHSAIHNPIHSPMYCLPSPSPSPSPDTHTHTAAGDSVPGWALDEWFRFAEAWNATERAEPWPYLTPPDGWSDLAATPGWRERAMEALARLPTREFFDRPLPVTRFFDYVDRIRAGEFAAPKSQPRKRQPTGGNL